MHRAFLFALALVGAGLGPVRAAEEPWLGQGNVIASKSASLRFSSPRVITKVTREYGAFVKKGDVLVQCDEKQAKAALNLTQLAVKKAELTVKDAEARVAAAKATVELRKAEFEANPSKTAKPALELAQAELAMAVVHIEIAKVELEFAKETLTSEERKLEELVLRAPFDGFISGRYAEAGDIVPAGTTVIEMIGPPMIVQSNVPDRLVKSVAVKYPVEVTLLKEFGGDTYKCEISRMATVIDTKDRSFAIHVSLPEAAQQKIFPGMVVNMKIVPKE